MESPKPPYDAIDVKSRTFAMKRGSAQYRKSLATLSAPYQSGSDWARVREDAIVFPPARGKKGSKGPRSLAAMCCRVLADNFGAASGSAIQPLPEHLLWALWKELYARNMSLHAWNILAPVLLGERHDRATSRSNTPRKDLTTLPMAMFRYCQEIINPPCDLSVYMAPLAELEEGTLAYLCIDNVDRFQTHELMALAKLPQLVVLELIEREPTDSKISDALIRGWSEVGKEPFPRLRVLKITSRSHWVSENGLQYLWQFPHLEIFDITALPKSRLQASRGLNDILDGRGWKITEPRGSLFVSYAEAIVDGQMAVHPTGVQGLKTVFEDDRHQVVWVDNPRAPLHEQREKDVERRVEKRGVGGPRYGDESDSQKQETPDYRNSKYLDDGWRAVLQGTLPLMATDGARASSTARDQEMSDDQVFWFLALLDQGRYDDDDEARRQALGVTLPVERLVTLRLRNPSNTAEQSKRLLNSERLIFSRRREHSAKESRSGRGLCLEKSEVQQPWALLPGSGSEEDLKPRKRYTSEAERPSNPSPSWAPRPDDRREKNLEPRKRLKRPAGDFLSQFK